MKRSAQFRYFLFLPYFHLHNAVPRIFGHRVRTPLRETDNKTNERPITRREMFSTLRCLGQPFASPFS